MTRSAPIPGRAGDPLNELVAGQGFVLLDGGLATHLEALGFALAGRPDWSAAAITEAPDLLVRAHRDFLRAGADVVSTATYQARVGSVGSGRSRFRRAVELARRAVELEQRDALVVGSLGPYGALRADGSEYTGGYRLQARAYRDLHGPRIEALQEAGCRLLAFETMPNLGEIEAVLGLIEESAAPAWLSLSLDAGGALADGTPLATVRRMAEAVPLVGLGVNCVPPSLVADALRELAPSRWTLLAYPNSGERYRPGEGFAGSPEALTPFLETWWSEGLRVVGGCCRTTPRDIRGLRRRLEELASAEHHRERPGGGDGAS